LSKTLFTDTTSLWLENNQIWRWVPAEEPYHYPKSNHHSKCHVWAGISSKGVIGPHVFFENVNGEVYLDVLKTWMPDIKEMFKFTATWRFQPDNDPTFTYIPAQRFLAENHVDLLEWPSNFPDLNPIENLWGSNSTRCEEARVNRFARIRNSNI